MFYFKSKNNVEYKFNLININNKLYIDFSAKEKIGPCSVKLGGLLSIKNNEVEWSSDGLHEFDADIRNYIQKVVKLKVFI